jgi:hypothetical protein
VIADDSVLLREGIAELLTKEGFTVVGSVSNATDLLHSWPRTNLECSRCRYRRHSDAAHPYRRRPAGCDHPAW